MKASKLLIPLAIFAIPILILLAACAPKPAEEAAVTTEEVTEATEAETTEEATVEMASDLYAGAEVCANCHSDVHDNWSQTKHLAAFEDLEKSGEMQDFCLQCHTVGYDPEKPGGYDDIANKELLAGVQCESCHGPAAEHAKNPAATKPTVTVAADLCGTCHTGPHNPFFEEWSESKHAEALEGLKSAGEHAQDVCLQCHSADVLINPEVTLADAETSITCVKCHNPHGSENEAQLRVTVEETCVQCHTAGSEAAPGKPVHHATAEVINGTGGVGVETVVTHAKVEGLCTTCHMVTKEYESDENPAVTGHTFEPSLEACSTCHGEKGEEMKEETQAEIQAKVDEIKAKLEAIDPATLEGDALTAYNNAKFNYEMVVADGSMGVHNKPYTQALLDVALQELAKVK